MLELLLFLILGLIVGLMGALLGIGGGIVIGLATLFGLAIPSLMVLWHLTLRTKAGKIK